ncbi:uncharacterized protein LOC106132233 [Amyelois transitella]|uniref:uncharacterized protein LOC106132233 n=1 Tax=Amyelois transitella TaxID=680683 RepID=UPI00067C9319|nr:uncharacterized protein LOC106132233 [Amyelois transitella]
MKMGKKKKNNGKKGGNRFFRWIRSDLPDEEDKKSPVLLLGVNKISDSPSFLRRRSIEPVTTGSIRFFRPPKSKYTRGLQGDERLEKIRQDLLVHKTKSDRYTPQSHEVSVEPDDKRCLKFNCVGNCICDRKKSSNRGSFSFHRPDNDNRNESKDLSENDIEFKYTEHVTDAQPSSSKQSSYNVTPKSAERRHFLLSNLNERFRKTLSLDSRKVETNRVPLSLPQESRPKSLVNTGNICVQHLKTDPFVPTNFDKANQPKKKRKSFFSLDTFFDKKSDTSSIDDYCSSKYKRFELESDDSPLFRRDLSPRNGEKTPDLLNLPVIIDSVRKKQSDTKRQLEKLESHYYKSLIKSRAVIDAVPKDATDVQGPSGRVFNDDDDVEYIEPIRSNFTSQSTLILDKNIPDNKKSILTINTDETDIKLPSSTVTPNENDLDSIGAYEIEVKESDLLKDCKELTVKVMDKSVDSIGSCSLDVDASTDFSDTTSGSLNLLTPSSTTSCVRDFTSRIQERVGSNLQVTPVPTPIRTPDDPTPTPKNKENLLKPPPKIHIDTGSHRSRTHHKKRDEVQQKKPSYLNLACSVNGYTNLTTYDSKLRQDINKSREASPIRPITHTYHYRSENNSLLVPVPVSANKLLVPNLGPHDTRGNLTGKAPPKAQTDPYLATSPLHAFMAAENKQLKNDFLGPSMTTASRSYISTETKNYASSMLKTDEVDNAQSLTFKSSYSESNFRKTVSNGKETRYNSESYTISSNGMSKRVEITKENGEKLTSPMKSFIQQRVERLYGPGALAQGFFNQKRHKLRSQSDEDEPKVLTEKSMNCPSESYLNPRKSVSFESENVYSSPNGETGELDVSLPVLRHLRPEFRAQLPIVSPKKNVKTELSPLKPGNIPIQKTEETQVPVSSDLVTNGVSVISLDEKETVNGVNCAGNGKEVVKDGHYFLDLEKKETERLLALSATAEKELESLQDREDVSEEILGFLRSASGKARLLATQKMQQFEGLCYNNINERLDEPFPTTVEDLQGFWDMVCLQVKHVDAMYENIAALKANNWQEISAPSPRAQAPPSRGRARAPPPAHTERARLAAEKREADRRAMLEHRRRVARERQLAARASAAENGRERDLHMGIEGSQEVEIFVGKTKPTTASTGDAGPSTES